MVRSEVAADCKADSLFDFLVGSILWDNSGIVGRLVGWYLVLCDEEESIGAAVWVGIIALCTLAYLVTHLLGPLFAFWIAAEFLVACFATGVNVDGVARLGRVPVGWLVPWMEELFEAVGAEVVEGDGFMEGLLGAGFANDVCLLWVGS
jgi:hypothetical protein